LKKIILLNKKEGETPLACMERFRASKKIPKEMKMTYAGRLDPMASGLLLVLAGEGVHEKEKYLKLDKEYEFEILFGFSTDTHDILGKITHSLIRANGRIDKIDLEKNIKNNLKYFKGKFVQKYPIYSSKTVAGKPLFEYGREDKEVEIPEKEVNVKSLKFLKLKNIGRLALLKNIEKRIKKVQGDFRQKEILSLWQELLRTNTWKHVQVGSFSIACSSGTYVRSIANGLGEKIGVPALAYSIKRTKIGKYSRGV